MAKKRYNPNNPAMQRATGTTNRSTQSAALNRFKDQVGLEAPGSIDIDAINRKYAEQVAAANNTPVLNRFKDQIGLEAPGFIDVDAINKKFAEQVAAVNNSSGGGPSGGLPSGGGQSGGVSSGGGQSGGGNATQDALAALLSQPAAPAAEPAPYVDPYVDARAEAQRAAEARRQFLRQWASGARTTMNQASDNAAAMLAAQVNPYENMQMVAPSVLPAIYGTYLQQSGVSPEQVQALIAVSAAEQAANDQALRGVVDMLAASTNVAQDSRISDVELARALGGLDVDNRLMAATLGVDEGEAAALARFAELTRQDQLAFDDRIYNRGQDQYNREQDERQMRLDRVNSIVSAVGDQLDPMTILEMYAQAGA